MTTYTSGEGIAELLTCAGLRMAESPNPARGYVREDYLFAQCVMCGVEAHYKPRYIMQKTHEGEPTCRACYWRAWNRDALMMYGQPEISRQNEVYADDPLLAYEHERNVRRAQKRVEERDYE